MQAVVRDLFLVGHLRGDLLARGSDAATATAAGTILPAVDQRRRIGPRGWNYVVVTSVKERYQIGNRQGAIVTKVDSVQLAFLKKTRKLSAWSTNKSATMP